MLTDRLGGDASVVSRDGRLLPVGDLDEATDADEPRRRLERPGDEGDVQRKSSAQRQ
jgi:hypothetical protein